MNINDEYGPPYQNVFNYNKHDYYTAQLFLELRVFPIQKSKISPVAIIGYGTGSALFSQYLDDGDCWRAGAGFEIKIRKFLKIDFTCTYNYQELKYHDPDHYYQYKDEPKLYLAYTGVNVGFIFLLKGSRYARTFLVE